jgi:hypothetical protein
VERVLSFVVPLHTVEVLGSKWGGGAHTNNPEYFKYTHDTLVLRNVCWLHVGLHAKNVPAGRYAVLLHIIGSNFALSTTAHASSVSSRGSWETCSATYAWKPSRKKVGRRGVLSLGETTLAVESHVKVEQLNTEAG